MKRAVMCILAGMMVLSLAACTPTTEKNKTGEVKQTEAAVTGGSTGGSTTGTTSGQGVVTDRMPDPNEPDVEVLAIYNLSEDGTKVEGTMDAVEEMTPQALVDLLIKYEVLEEGTEVVSYEAEGTPATEEVGPGIVKIPGFEITSDMKEYGTLVLNQFPEDKQELRLQAVINTFTENMDVVYLTVQSGDRVLAEQKSFGALTE